MSEMNDTSETSAAPPAAFTPDPWGALRAHTAARIALGRAGGSLPTQQWLSFSLDHALARDAVHDELDPDQLRRDVGL